MMDKAINDIMDQQTATDRLFEALVLVLDEKNILSLQDLLPMLDIMRIHAQLREGETVGRCMGFVIDRLRAHAEARATGGQPRHTLLLDAMLFSRTDPAKRASLESWLAIATKDELVDEIAQALRQPDAEGGA